MNKGRKLILLTLLLLLTVGSYVVINKNLALTGTDQNGNSWTYTTSGNTITITKYNTTNKTNVTVPRPMIINGTSYSNVILNGAVFQDHTEITSLTLSNGIKSGTSCNSMFRGLTKLTVLNLNNFDTSSATNMGWMFCDCSSLIELDLSNFNTSNVTIMQSMFQNCSSLTSLNISNFDTSNVTSLVNIFRNLSSLDLLDISSFDLRNLSNYHLTLWNKTIKIGNGKISNKVGWFMRGTWRREEDGKNYSGIEIYQKMLNGQALGTYTKVSNISKEMKTTFPVDYKVESINSETEVTFNNNGNSNIVKEGNKIYVTNIPLITTSQYNVPGSFTILMKDVVIDKYNNKYNLKLTMSNMRLYNLTAYSGISMFIFNPLTIDKELFIIHHMYKNIGDAQQMNSVAYNNDNAAAKYDINLQVVDNNGNVKSGSFIFSATDLDTPSALDNNSLYKSNRDSMSGYGEYSEGINLGDGMDLSTLTMSDPTFLISPSTGRLTGSRDDDGTELSEFLVKADASGANFTWTAGESAGTEILSYYQPSIVEIVKKDNHGNNVSGAKLQLYYGDELYNGPNENEDNTWITNNSTKKLFLMPGEYTLKEVTHPNQYESSEDITFYVDINDKLVINNKEVDNITMVDNLVKKKYKVNYLEKGTNKVIRDQKISSDTEYGTVINSSDEKVDITNYEYDSSDKSSITIDVDEENNIINLYYKKIEKKIKIRKETIGNKEGEFTYKVRAYEDISSNIESQEVIGTAEAHSGSQDWMIWFASPIKIGNKTYQGSYSGNIINQSTGEMWEEEGYTELYNIFSSAKYTYNDKYNLYETNIDATINGEEVIIYSSESHIERFEGYNSEFYVAKKLDLADQLGEEENGVYTFKLNTNGEKEISIPIGFVYEIEEVAQNGWKLVSINNDSSKKKIQEESKNNAEYTFKNEQVVKEITIKKELYGNMADINKSFKFNVEVVDQDGKVVDELSGEFYLRSNQENKISIPIGYSITVSEEKETNYTTTVNDTNTNSITKTINDNETITFKNTYEGSTSTGVFNIIIPYIILIILSFIFIGGYAYINKKIKA